MKKYLLSIIILAFAVNVFAQDRPHYMTPAEKELMKTYVPPFTITDDNNPPPGPVRTMAEWEECQGILIKWTQFTSILTEIVRYASQEGLVFILTSDSNSVKSALTSASIPLTNIRYIRGGTTGNNTIWARDYGPWAVYSGVADSLKLIDWIYNRPRPGDDTNSVTLGQFLNIPVHRTLVSPNDLIHTGGNFMADGNGTGFSSKLILNENPGKTEAQINAIMNSYMGINRYVKMETLPYDEIHHIDMHIKLLDEETLLVGQYPAGIADGPQIEANLQYVLSNYQTCYGKPYKVVRIPMPPASNGQYPNTGADYRTYTNSLIINKTVLVPTYAPQYDTTALRIYRETMPGYRVIGINCNAIIPSLGAIHCITKEIGVYEPVFISHSGLRNTNNTSTPYQVKAYVKTRTGVANAKVYWTTDTTTGFTAVNMTAAGDTFTANIPAQPLNTHIYYYISASSNSGRTVTKPLPAPSGNYRFMITNATGITNNGVEINSYTLAQNYPNPFNPSTLISYQLPSRGFVKLTVYDVSGKAVNVLVNENKPAGRYSVQFDGTNLSSGIYFYTLKAPGFSETKKMLLIK